MSEHFLSVIEKSDLLNIINHIYDGIEIWDNNYNLIFTNQSCYRLYGATQQEMMGRNLTELMDLEKFWAPSTLPYVYEKKIPILQKQRTFLGREIDVIAVPVLNTRTEVEYVVMVAREQFDKLAKKLSPVEKLEGRKSVTTD